MAFLPTHAVAAPGGLSSGARCREGAVSARRLVGTGGGARLGSARMGPSDAAAGNGGGGGGGVDPPLAPVPSRAGRVKVRRGWSNTTGELIRRVCEDVWVVERACTLGGERGGVEWGGAWWVRRVERAGGRGQAEEGPSGGSAGAEGWLLAWRGGATG